MLGSLVVGIGLAFFTMFLWYIFQPVVMTIIDLGSNILVERGFNNTYVNGGLNILKQEYNWFGVIIVIAIAVIWLFVAAQGRDWRSTETQY